MNVAVRSKHLNLISICSGGGGLDLGVELAIPSARSVCMVEREAFAVASLVAAMEQGQLHQAPVWSDANTFDGRAWRGAVDGLIGGIPCQPHSLAGRKQGSLDARDLWSTARRIIVQSGAWFVLIENVGGMLAAGSDEIAGAQRVFRDLSKLGFETEGGLFTAAEVGASHQRERIFIVGVLDDTTGRRERRNRGSISGSADADGPSRPNGRQRDAEHTSEGVSGVGLADTYSERLEGIGTDAGAQGRPDARRSARLCDRTVVDDAFGRRWTEGRDDNREHERYELGSASEYAVVDAEGFGCGEGWPEPSVRSGRDTTAITSGSVDDASIARGRRVSVQPRRQVEARPDFDRPSIFPPGPNDLDGWRSTLASSPELEPAFRRVADGLASRLDIGRVDRLRMLGNGVVPLQAAYAIRTLVTRLASRGSAGAARLVRMMESVDA